MYKTEYVPPILTVDSVLFQLIDGVLNVLLIQRNSEPFKDWWALPGGYCAAGETTTQAMGRVLEAKAGINTADLGVIEQLYTFDTVARDPRGHAVSVTYMGIGLCIEPHLDEQSQNPQFFPLTDLPEIAYDHKQIIRYALERLRSKMEYTNVCFALLPALFTLSDAQAAYEAVIGHTLDRRNFRKKFQSLGVIEPVQEMRRDGAHRPAQLYKFKSTQLETLQRSFE